MQDETPDPNVPIVDEHVRSRLVAPRMTPRNPLLDETARAGLVLSLGDVVPGLTRRSIAESLKVHGTIGSIPCG